MSNTILRRSFFGAGLAAATATTINSTHAQVFEEPRFDVILSLTKQSNDGSEDLGGLLLDNVIAADIKGTPCCSLGSDGANAISWQTSALGNRSTTVYLPTTGLGEEIRLESLAFQDLESSTLTRVASFSDVVIPVDLAGTQVLSKEIQNEDSLYQLFGVVSRRSAYHAEATIQKVEPVRQTGACGSYRFENALNWGYYSVPFTKDLQWRLHGPEYHPLDTRCRPQCTWHMNFLLKRSNSNYPFQNHHFGAYVENRSFCLIYWDNLRVICKKRCSSRVPTWSEVYNFSYEAIDSTFRGVGVSLPFFVIAAIATIFAAAFFAGLGAVAFA